MSDWWSVWYNKYAAVVVGAIFGYTGYTQVCWSGVEGQTWAAWVQAVGSVAAIGGAVWTVTRQESERKKDARLRADILGAAMVLQLAAVAGEVQSVQLILDHAKEDGGHADDFRSALEALVDCDQIDAQEVAALAPVANRCAFKIARAIDCRLAAIRALKKFTMSRSLDDAGTRKERAALISLILNESALNFKRASQDLQQVALASTPLQE